MAIGNGNRQFNHQSPISIANLQSQSSICSLQSSMSYFTNLECSTPCGAGPFDAHVEQHLCPSCGMPLLARYDLKAARAWKRESLPAREASMWRYRELMPLFD